MNFFKNPEFSSIRTILAIVIVLGVGFGVYKIVGNNTSLQGSAFLATKKSTVENVAISFDFNKDGSCTMNACLEDKVNKGTMSCISYEGVTGSVSGQNYCNTSTSVSQHQYSSYQLTTTTLK